MIYLIPSATAAPLPLPCVENRRVFDLTALMMVDDETEASSDDECGKRRNRTRRIKGEVTASNTQNVDCEASETKLKPPLDIDNG